MNTDLTPWDCVRVQNVPNTLDVRYSGLIFNRHLQICPKKILKFATVTWGWKSMVGFKFLVHQLFRLTYNNLDEKYSGFSAWPPHAQQNTILYVYLWNNVHIIGKMPFSSDKGTESPFSKKSMTVEDSAMEPEVPPGLVTALQAFDLTTMLDCVEWWHAW